MSGGFVSIGDLAIGSVDHLALSHALPEKYMSETWKYPSTAEILTRWTNAFGSIARVSDNFIRITSAGGVGQVGSLALHDVWDVRVSPLSNYTLNAFTFKATVVFQDSTTADYFIGLSSAITNLAVDRDTWYEELDAAIGFVRIGTEIKGYLQTGAGGGLQEVVDLSTTIVSTITQLSFRVNASGSVEFFVNGVLKGTSVDSPDRRTTGQMAPIGAVRGSAKRLQLYGISSSTTFFDF